MADHVGRAAPVQAPHRPLLLGGRIFFFVLLVVHAVPKLSLQESSFPPAGAQGGGAPYWGTKHRGGLALKRLASFLVRKIPCREPVSLLHFLSTLVLRSYWSAPWAQLLGLQSFGRGCTIDPYDQVFFSEPAFLPHPPCPITSGTLLLRRFRILTGFLWG